MWFLPCLLVQVCCAACAAGKRGRETTVPPGVRFIRAGQPAGCYHIIQEGGMSEAKRPACWTWEAYLEWEAGQPIRYELVDGEVCAMGGGTAEHDIIGNNLRAALHAQMRGKPCRSHGPDLKVKAGNDGRYPDALIDCGVRVPGALYAQEPVAVFEVLSKSTGWIDQGLKLRDYDATPGIRSYVLISQDEQRAMVYTRDTDGRLGIRSAALLEGAGASIDIPDLDVALPFSLLYEGLDFAADGTADT
jgi:Uma2 family endonuclease